MNKTVQNKHSPAVNKDNAIWVVRFQESEPQIPKTVYSHVKVVLVAGDCHLSLW